MLNRKSFFMGVVASLVLVLSLLLLTGAVTPNSPNYFNGMRGLTDYPCLEVECSSNGSVVYIADETRVMRSMDFGRNWEVIMTSNKREHSEEQE
jgi:hypothetical protein